MAILTDCEVLPPKVGAREVMDDVLRSARENVGGVDTCNYMNFTVDGVFLPLNLPLVQRTLEYCRE